MTTAPTPDPRLPERPSPPAPSADQAPTVAPAPGTHKSPTDGARTPAEYDEEPGSHRRPSDGAALDVGG